MRIEDILLRQNGVVSRVQATRCGVSPRAMRGRVRRGLMAPVHPGVDRSAVQPLTDHGRIRAAALWGGERAVVDGAASAFWYGFLSQLPPGTRVGLTVPHAVRRRAPAGIRLRRRDLDPRDLTRIDGIAVTGIGLTVLETAIALPDGPAFLDRALQRKVPFELLYEAFCRSVGAHGWSQARELLYEAANRADSRAERRLIDLLRRTGVTGFVRDVPFGDWRIDLAFLARRIAVEFDGWAYHSDVDRFQNDRTKQNALVAAGWTVLRFTWHDLVRRPEYIVGHIRHALET